MIQTLSTRNNPPPMKLIELHILQSFPVSCLNRDDMNSPKTATFGGVQRARVSSQCWKRQIRLMCADLDKPKFKGQRSRQFIGEITKRLAQSEGSNAEMLSKCISHYLGKLDPKSPGKVKTIAYYTEDELDRFAGIVSSLSDEDKAKLVAAISDVDESSLAKDDDDGDTHDAEATENEPAPKKKGGGKKTTAKAFSKLLGGIFKPAIKKAFKGAPMVKDAADIALFGRMVAADHNLTLEGAAMFSHALSTHRVDNEIDFFTAVDDLNPTDDSGSGHMGTTEFNAATYYRYAAINLTMLRDEDHLSTMTDEEIKAVVAAFIEATICAIPKARKNSMNANTPADYVLGIVKEKGQPVQLVNAFETPVRSSNGLLAASARELLLQRRQLNEYYGGSNTALATGMLRPSADPEAAHDGRQLTGEDVPEWVNLPTFIERLAAHVL